MTPTQTRSSAAAPSVPRDRAGSITLHVGYTILAASTANVDVPVSTDAIVTAIRWRFYPGPELSVQLRPVILRQDEELPLPWYPPASTGAKQFLDGDDDDVRIQLSRRVYAGEDTLRVKIDNTDPVNSYDIAVDFELVLMPAGSSPHG